MDIWSTPRYSTCKDIFYNKLIEVLVDAGADLLAKDALGLTPLDLADKADHTETMAVLRGAVDRQEQEKQRDFYSLLDACAGGDLATVKAILGAENHPSDLVNFVPNGSSSLLFKASEHGQKEVVKYLLESGARAVIHPVTKYSPLYIAAYNGKKDIVEGIFDHGEDFPAGRVRPTEGELIWVLDSAAAATCKRAA